MCVQAIDTLYHYGEKSAALWLHDSAAVARAQQKLQQVSPETQNDKDNHSAEKALKQADGHRSQ